MLAVYLGFKLDPEIARSYQLKENEEHIRAADEQTGINE
jgi:hypothetical protein